MAVLWSLTPAAVKPVLPKVWVATQTRAARG